jgi:hypothetical protein
MIREAYPQLLISHSSPIIRNCDPKFLRRGVNLAKHSSL